MATITTGGSGNWSSTTPDAPWPGGTLPTNADDVVIAAGHTVTLDVATAVAKSCLITGVSGGGTGGKLTADASVDTKLVLQEKLHVQYPGGSNYNAMLDIDMSAAPTKKCEIYVNAANGSGSSYYIYFEAKVSLKGAERTRRTYAMAALTANSSTSVDVEDATGWRVGDILVFATTQAYNATPRIDEVTIATITPTTGTEATITWSDGAGTAGAVLYDHADGCMVGNFSSNLIIGPNTPGNRLGAQIDTGSASSSLGNIYDNVMFNAWGTTGGAFLYNGVMVWRSTALRNTAQFTNNAFYKFEEYGYYLLQTGTTFAGDIGGHVFYSTASGSQAIVGSGITAVVGSDTGSSIFRGYDGVDQAAPGSPFIDLMISGCTRRAYSVQGYDSKMIGGAIWGCNLAAYSPQGISAVPEFVGTRFGNGPSATHPAASANNSELASFSGATSMLLDSCVLNTSGGSLTASLNGASDTTYLQLLNKNNDAAVQEIYRNVSNAAPVFLRDASTINRATSSLRIDIIGTANREWTWEVPVLARAGQALKILLYVRKTTSYKTGSYSEPTATLSGLGITPVVATAGAGSDNAWELLTIDLSSGSAPAADGNLTLTLTAQSATNGAQCWFSGIPLAPFVTRARHYGYLFDETSPTRTANGTVSAAEATAAAYTGMTVTWGASSSSTAITADTTFQKLYDYTQAQACLNVGSALPLTGAGVAGNPALFAAGDVTIDTGYKLNGNGSISMGSSTLTTETASTQAYTYTGGTWTQPTTVPTFSGGTLALSDEGTWVFNTGASTIVTFAPTDADVTYALGDGTYVGTLDLRNTHGSRAITVELPSGTSYTTASNTGATITVSLPVVTADISITGMPNASGANNRLQIINTTAITAAARADSTAYSAGDIRLRQTGIGTENTAGLYLRCTTPGTSDASPPTWNATVGGTTTDGTAVWTTYAVLYYDDDPAATSLADTYIDGEEFLAGETVAIRCSEMDADTSFKTYSTAVIVATTGFSALVAAEANDVYATNALDGSDYESTFSPDYTNDRLVLDTDTDFAGKAAFAYFCYLLTTSQGMYEFWGGVTALDEGNYRINSDVLDMYFDESGGFVKQTDNVRFFRKDGTRPALDPTTGGNGIEINWRVPVNVVPTGGSALTSEESAKLLALPSASATASATLAAATTTPIAANVKEMNDTALQGDGTEADKFRSVLVA